MRSPLYISIAFLLAACSSGKSNISSQNSVNYFVEDQVCSCIDSLYSADGYSIYDSLDIWHDYLVESHQIEDKSKVSLYNIYTTIKSSNSIEFIDESKLKQEEFDLVLNPFNTCTAKYYKQYQSDITDSKLIEIINTQKELGYGFSASDLATISLNILTPDDFSHNYYKYSILHKTWALSVKPREGGVIIPKRE